MDFNLLDIIIVLILLASLIIGYNKGFIGAVAGMVSTLAGLGIAFLFRNQAADYLEEQYGLVTDLIIFLEKKLTASAGLGDQPGWVTSLPIIQNGLAALHRQIAEFAYLLVAAGCFLILYVLSSMLIGIICLMLERILPRWVLGSINRPGGVVVILSQNILIMAALAGILASPLYAGAQLGFKVAAPLVALMQASVLLPFLLQIFAGLQDLIKLWV